MDWTVRHGHAIALSAVLHDAVERVVSQGLYQVVTDAAVSHADTDRVSLTVGRREGISFAEQRYTVAYKIRGQTGLEFRNVDFRSVESGRKSEKWET